MSLIRLQYCIDGSKQVLFWILSDLSLRCLQVPLHLRAMCVSEFQVRKGVHRLIFPKGPQFIAPQKSQLRPIPAMAIHRRMLIGVHVRVYTS